MHLTNRRNTLFSISILGVFLCLFYAGGYLLISGYYEAHPAHYDSVGTYSIGFQILDAVRTRGFGEALSGISPHYISMAPLQAYFAWFLSPVLSKSEASFHLYNTLCLTGAFIGIFVFGRRVRMRPQYTALLCLLVLLPDGLYWWQLGVFDYRRDPGCLFLITASFFLMLGYFVRREREQGSSYRSCGFLLGLFTGLALISRDSAFGFIFGIVALPALVFWIRGFCRDGGRAAFYDLVWPAIGLILPAIIWLHALNNMMARLTNPFIFNGVGIDPFTSFTRNMPHLVDVWANPFLTENHAPWVFTALVIILATGAFLLSRCPQSEPRPVTDKVISRDMLITSIWSIIYVHLFLSLIVGWNISENIGPIGSVAPYYYSLAGGYGLIAAGLMRLQSQGRPLFLNLVLISSAILILAAALLRAEGRNWQFATWQMDAHNYLSTLTNKEGKPAVVAELWTEPLLAAVQLSAIKKDVAAQRRLFVEFDGQMMDTFVGAPKEKEEAFKLVLKKAVLCEADYIITTITLSSYEEPESNIMLFRNGRDMIEDIRQRLEKAPNKLFAPAGSLEGWPILIIDNRDRLACPR